MNEKLKPCPFCGGEASPKLAPYIGGGGCGYIVDCNECWSKTGYYSQAAEAIDAWNRRTTLGSEGTCKATVDTDYYEGKLDKFTCSECAWSGYVDDGFAVQTIPNCCPNCGRRVEHD